MMRPLIATLLFVGMLFAWTSPEHSVAQGTGPAMYLGAAGPSVVQCANPPACTAVGVTVGITFQVILYAASVPDDGYFGFEAFLSQGCKDSTDACSGPRYLLAHTPRTTDCDEIVWPDVQWCFVSYTTNSGPEWWIGGATSENWSSAPVSHFTGGLVELDMKCTSAGEDVMRFDRAPQYLSNSVPSGSIDAKIINFSSELFIHCNGIPQVPTPTGTPTLPGTHPSVTPQPTRTNTPTPTPEFGQGDVNCDRATNAVDAALILQYSAGLLHTLPCTHYSEDVNGDGVLNAIDAALILQFSAGLLSWDCLDGYC